MKQYRLSIDDNIRFMENITTHSYNSIFQDPFLNGLQHLHETYSMKVQLNMYFSYCPESFALSAVSTRYLQEFEANKDWLRLSFHARHNEPAGPYRNASPDLVLKDYHAVTTELHRIAGEAAQSRFLTLHYVAATQQSCLALQDCGVDGFMGLFSGADKQPCSSYYLTEAQATLVRTNGIWQDAETGLYFICNHMVTNNHSQSSALDGVQKMIASNQSYIDLMVHEQYFYSDYVAYQPDYFLKLDSLARLLSDNGYQSVLLDDIL